MYGSQDSIHPYLPHAQGSTPTRRKYQDSILHMVAECEGELRVQITAIDQIGIRMVGRFGYQNLHHKVSKQDNIHTTNIPMVG